MALSLSVLALALPAQADRHCMPALEAYYGARHALQSAEGSCQTRMENALQRLRGAHDFAAACGCRELGDAVRALTDEIAADGIGCETAGERLHDFAQTMEDQVQACH